MFNILVPDVFITSRCNFDCKYCFESSKSNKDLDIERFKKYCSEKHFIDFFIFGGEPLMKSDILEEIIENTPQDRRSGLKGIITNGSLIEENIDFIKKYGITCQISVDGPQYINDKNRVYPNGEGTFDTIMHSIDICEENDIKWRIHGVVNKETLPHIAEIYEWFYDTKRRHKSIEETIEEMDMNIFQIIFEENYTDKDINIFLEQLEEICKRFLNKDELTEEQAKCIIMKIFDHKGGMCGVGNGLMAINTNLDVYPCHRLASVPNKQKFKLGNLMNEDDFEHLELFNSFMKVKQNRFMYSTDFVNNGYKDKENTRLFNWCPATNLQTTESVYYINPKYAIMHKEANRKIKELIDKYGLNRKSNNCN